MRICQRTWPSTAVGFSRDILLLVTIFKLNDLFLAGLYSTQFSDEQETFSRIYFDDDFIQVAKIKE
jgi:hypothetical protein